MELIFLRILCVILIVLIIFSFYKLSEARAMWDYCHKQYEKWESEYWYLRSSKAINKGYEIHLSWLERGKDNSIIERESAK